MDGRDQRDMYRGFGDGFTRAFEMALTPAVFGVFGYMLDRWIGIVPVLTIVLFLMAVFGQFVKMYYTYDARMKVHEAAGPWAARPVAPLAQPPRPTAPSVQAAQPPPQSGSGAARTA